MSKLRFELILASVRQPFASHVGSAPALSVRSWFGYCANALTRLAVLAPFGGFWYPRARELNPYDYGRWGGIRRSSPLANALFTAMLWPGIGSVVARTETKGILRRVLEGELHDPRNLPTELVYELSRCGALPGHARAFRSLCLQWRSWISARTRYAAINLPITLVYGEDDWSRPAEREANARAIPSARTTTLANSGHFSCLEKPQEIAELIGELV